MMSFQKIYGLYGLEHHTVEINGDVTMRTDGRTNEQTSENRATQSLDSVRLSFAIFVPQHVRLFYFADRHFLKMVV